MQIGAVFDWDGVIVDSSVQHERSWERLAVEENKELPSGHFEKSFGMKNERVIPDVLGWTDRPEEIQRLSLRKEALYRVLVQETGLSPLPGTRTFLSRLAEAGIPCVIGSSTHRLNIETTLDVMDLRGFFQDIVSAEDVSHGKPDPEVFLTAATRINRQPEACFVFEDAHVGIEAGLAGGFAVIGVASTHPRETLVGARHVVDRLDELSIVDLSGLLVAPRS